MKNSSIKLNATSERLPLTSAQRLSRHEEQSDTCLYLAYGSNLSVQKFRGDRGVRPLSEINVQVPSLRLVFDLPGVPYKEPCFANSALRISDDCNESDHYHKDDWHKGLIGAVYEVTKSDYAHIIATEGGGSGYKDIEVDCHPFNSSDPTVAVPQTPTTKPFKAHTLFAPAATKHERNHRPDPSYAQPSARYLKLITDGAAELALPYEYQDYLHSIRPFRITTLRQKMGQLLFASSWLPGIMAFFTFSRIFADKNGILPKWVQQLSRTLFASMWTSYDYFYKPLFGEGERSIGDSSSGDFAEKDRVSELGEKQAIKLEDAAATAT